MSDSDCQSQHPASHPWVTEKLGYIHNLEPASGESHGNVNCIPGASLNRKRFLSCVFQFKAHFAWPGGAQVTVCCGVLGPGSVNRGMADPFNLPPLSTAVLMCSAPCRIKKACSPCVVYFSTAHVRKAPDMQCTDFHIYCYKKRDGSKCQIEVHKTALVSVTDPPGAPGKH